MNKRYLGIIPARAGSKGIPNKNMTDLGGKPLIAYTLSAASASKNLDRIIFTSDSPVMVEFAGSFPRIEVPFIRPSELAQDDTPQKAVVKHACEEIGYETFDHIFLLEPTCPFRTTEDIDMAIDMHSDKCPSECLVGLSRVLQHPCEMVSLSVGIRKAVEAPNHNGRQAFPEYFFISGAVYITPKEFFMSHGKLYDDLNFVPFFTSQRSAVDIDEPFQLQIAEGLLKCAR